MLAGLHERLSKAVGQMKIGCTSSGDAELGQESEAYGEGRVGSGCGGAVLVIQKNNSLAPCRSYPGFSELAGEMEGPEAVVEKRRG